MLLLVCLRGNIFIWQGEELGLSQARIDFDQLRDPEAIANWPLTLGRDGARTPMPWQADAPNAGFSAAKPWLPAPPEHRALAVDRQEADPSSQLNLTRRLIALRQSSDALRTGELKVLEASDAVLAFERLGQGQHLLCVFNLGQAPAEWRPAQPDRWRVIEQVGSPLGWSLPPFAGLIAERIA
jgi:alpha-glucosidase